LSEDPTEKEKKLKENLMKVDEVLREKKAMKRQQEIAEQSRPVVSNEETIHKTPELNSNEIFDSPSQKDKNSPEANEQLLPDESLWSVHSREIANLSFEQPKNGKNLNENKQEENLEALKWSEVEDVRPLEASSHDFSEQNKWMERDSGENQREERTEPMDSRESFGPAFGCEKQENYWEGSLKENLEKVFKILDKEKNGVISTGSLSFPEGIEECDADLLSDILSSHSSPEIGFDMFWDLLNFRKNFWF
jgi:hypothetical protein